MRLEVAAIAELHHDVEVIIGHDDLVCRCAKCLKAELDSNEEQEEVYSDHLRVKGEEDRP